MKRPTDMKTPKLLLCALLALCPFAARGDANLDKARAYLEGRLPQGETLKVDWGKIPRNEWPAYIDHIAAKPVIDGNDARVVYALTLHGEDWPQLKPRHAEILAHYPPDTLKHYFVKYKKLAGAKPNTIHLKRMTPAELMLVTTGELTVKEHEQVRAEILDRCVKAVAKKYPEANAAVLAAKIKPVAEALDAPRWQGLAEATKDLGLDFGQPDHTAIEAAVTAKAKSLEEGRIQYGKRFAGSVLFLRGAAGYTEWEGKLPTAAAVVDKPADGTVAGPAGRAAPAAVAASVANRVADARKGAAPKNDPPDAFEARFDEWKTPHGAYLTKLKEKILAAHRAGDTAERDRLMALYRPWAEEYLKRDPSK